VEHNKSSCIRIQCEATGEYFPIPFCGVDRNAIINGRKKNLNPGGADMVMEYRWE
jgi:hypothetical protein